jgi:hypothetical protein
MRQKLYASASAEKDAGKWLQYILRCMGQVRMIDKKVKKIY